MIKKLAMLGLSNKEAETYLALAKEGETGANKIAKLTQSNRTVTYNILQNLLKKGLISYTVRNSKRLYKISSFTHLLTGIQEKQLLARDVISRLHKIKPKKKQEKGVEIFEGVEGLKTIHKEMLGSKTIRILNATGLIKNLLKYSLPLLKALGKNDVRIIANKTFQDSEIKEFKKVKVRYFPKNKMNYATTFIYKNNVVIQEIRKEPFIVKIRNKEVFEGYKQNFDLMWRVAKP
jgi:sugar-specific transcriptional regulator TrmB